MSNTITIGGVRLCCQCGGKRMAPDAVGAGPVAGVGGCWRDCADWREHGPEAMPWRNTRVTLVLVTGDRVEMLAEAYVASSGVSIVMTTPATVASREQALGPFQQAVDSEAWGRHRAWEWLRRVCGPGWVPVTPDVARALASVGVLT